MAPLTFIPLVHNNTLSPPDQPSTTRLPSYLHTTGMTTTYWHENDPNEQKKIIPNDPATMIPNEANQPPSCATPLMKPSCATTSNQKQK